MIPNKKQGYLTKGKSVELNFTTDEERRKLISGVLSDTLVIYKQKQCKTDEEVLARIERYFNVCVVAGSLPTIEGLALSLGVNRSTMLDWEQGKYNASRGPIITRAKEVIAEMDAQLVSMGKMNPIPYIFRAKNYYGLTDKTDVYISSSPLDNYNEAELKKSIKETIIIDAEFEDIK